MVYNQQTHHMQFYPTAWLLQEEQSQQRTSNPLAARLSWANHGAEESAFDLEGGVSSDLDFARAMSQAQQKRGGTTAAAATKQTKV